MKNRVDDKLKQHMVGVIGFDHARNLVTVNPYGAYAGDVPQPSVVTPGAATSEAQ